MERAACTGIADIVGCTGVGATTLAHKGTTDQVTTDTADMRVYAIAPVDTAAVRTIVAGTTVILTTAMIPTTDPRATSTSRAR